MENLRVRTVVDPAGQLDADAAATAESRRNPAIAGQVALCLYTVP
jgi:hypothetical protein